MKANRAHRDSIPIAAMGFERMSWEYFAARIERKRFQGGGSSPVKRRKIKEFNAHRARRRVFVATVERSRCHTLPLDKLMERVPGGYRGCLEVEGSGARPRFCWSSEGDCSDDSARPEASK
jgi:hypothetical protein